MIDTHAHLDAAADPADVLVERARAAGVDRIVSVGTKESSWHETLAIAERHDGVAVAEMLASVGAPFRARSG